MARLIHGHPHPDNIRIVAAALGRQAKKTEAVLDMGEPNIERNDCDTTACHAGWFLVDYLEGQGIGMEYKESSGAIELYLTGKWVFNDNKEKRVNFIAGQDLMAKTLGFEDKQDLMNWADENPELWGCRGGELMFGHDSAFIKDNEDKNTTPSLGDLELWWYGVADRTEAYLKEKGWL